jgi:hypothetical protein
VNVLADTFSKPLTKDKFVKFSVRFEVKVKDWSLTIDQEDNLFSLLH